MLSPALLRAQFLACVLPVGCMVRTTQVGVAEPSHRTGDKNTLRHCCTKTHPLFQFFHLFPMRPCQRRNIAPDDTVILAAADCWVLHHPERVHSSCGRVVRDIRRGFKTPTGLQAYVSCGGHAGRGREGVCAELAQWQRHVCLASAGATIDAGRIGRGTLHQPGLPHDKDRSRIKLYVDIAVCSNNFLRVWAGEIPPTIDGANNPPTMAAAPLSLGCAS